MSCFDYLTGVYGPWNLGRTGISIFINVFAHGGLAEGMAQLFRENNTIQSKIPPHAAIT